MTPPAGGFVRILGTSLHKSQPRKPGKTLFKFPTLQRELGRKQNSSERRVSCPGNRSRRDSLHGGQGLSVGRCSRAVLAEEPGSSGFLLTVHATFAPCTVWDEGLETEHFLRMYVILLIYFNQPTRSCVNTLLSLVTLNISCLHVITQV